MTGELDRIPIERALISVSDKSGLIELAQTLVEADIELVSTGSTAARLAEAGVPVTPVEQLTGFPESLDGRVKTLHPAIHAGLLADLRLESHRLQLAALGIAPFQLLVSNLYPFASTVASGADLESCIEQIDIGGPAMVRAAAKNSTCVAVVTSPDQYPQLTHAVQDSGFTLTERRLLAAAAFAHTAAYDAQVANWMGSALADTSEGTGFPSWRGETWTKVTTLRYGENPHQRAALYRPSGQATGLAAARQLHGKEMSYNNYVDSDSARKAVYGFSQPAVAIIKHANPCGIALGGDIAEAHRKAHACDPVSAFGGVIAANREVTAEMARQVADVFTEVVIAPAFAHEARDILEAKKNIRLLIAEPPQSGGLESQAIDGGLLLQDADLVDADEDRADNWQLVSGKPADELTLTDLEFAWRAARWVKSNAILLASDVASVGVGMGQVNRVDSARLAVSRAGDRAAGSVAASDAYFPFPDGLEILLQAGVQAVVQPGGSVRDELVVNAAKEAGATMYFTGTRHFYH